MNVFMLGLLTVGNIPHHLYEFPPDALFIHGNVLFQPSKNYLPNRYLLMLVHPERRSAINISNLCRNALETNLP